VREPAKDFIAVLRRVCELILSWIIKIDLSGKAAFRKSFTALSENRAHSQVKL
jgi:hypothetical protein